MTSLAWIVFTLSALLEVGGDAVVRHGLRGSKPVLIALGFAMLGGYGILVNTVKWDFSKLLGVYIVFFAFTGVLFGRFIFRESIPPATWLGLGFISLGGLLIQFGNR
jgi:small multidrug resistance family-3 protein